MKLDVVDCLDKLSLETQKKTRSVPKERKGKMGGGGALVIGPRVSSVGEESGGVEGGY